MCFPGNARQRMLLVAVLVLTIGVSAGLTQVFARGLVKFDPKTYKGKMGKIVVPYRGDSTLYIAKDTKNYGAGLTHLSTKNGTFVAPVGVYRPYYYYAVIRSGGKLRWSGRSTAGNKKLIVKPGGTATLNVGPPYSASVDVRQYGARVNLDLKFVDRGGGNALIQRHDAASTKPSFQVLSSAGKVLMKGAFEPG